MTRMWIAVAGVALIVACWAFGGRRESEAGTRRALGRARPPFEPTPGEAGSAGRKPEPTPVSARPLPAPLEDEDGAEAGASEEERRAERELWNTLRGLIESRDEIGWHECRRRIVEATATYMEFDAVEGTRFRSETDLAAAEIEQAEAGREAATQGLPDSLGDEDRERLAQEIEDRYQAQMEGARGRLETLLGRDEKGRRFIVGRLEEWLAAVERPR